MLPSAGLNITMGFYFFPRGGSAQVVRYLCRALAGTRWTPTLFAGSMGPLADSSNARHFFSNIDCRSLDYTAAFEAWRAGGDPMATADPMPASYEDKECVPDRIFSDLDNAAFDRQVVSWTRFFSSRSDAAPDVVHLHHLTPMHEAVRRLWPDVPLITHLHGTELKMLASTTPSRPYQREWAGRMQRWAAESDRVVVVAAHDQQLVQELLPVDPSRVTAVKSGVDTEVFAPRARTAVEAAALWKRCLVDEPAGWRPGQSEGSIRYDNDELSAFTDADGRQVPVVLFAGRFMKFKRLQLLIEAHHMLRSTTMCRPVLVIAGGFPGEWEGEHPYDTVQRLGATGVFFVGWKNHHDLAELLNCSDVFAAPSVEEPFGLVYLEAMASGVPPIATNTGGPLSFINVDPARPTGWFVPPDDVAATARALGEAVTDETARDARGANAARFIRDHYTWAESARAFAGLYDEVRAEPKRSPSSRPDRPTIGVA
jgi:glycosyltransferase involved in cell wall biosynthesis